ncbi:hypothetical protein [Halorubrum salsamenti]|uniref:hypothetical protein n=1 Tax=Halorubrum salsamenti TaxID=2583990 RepID=UPI0019D59323|nr:hypothetical protein [Halorubrum salsamenti]
MIFYDSNPERSRTSIRDEEREAEVQPVMTVSEDQLAVAEKTIRLRGQQFWQYGVVGPYTSEIHHESRYPTATKRTTRWFLTEPHRRYQLDNAVLPVDDTDCLGPVLTEDGYRFEIASHAELTAVIYHLKSRITNSTVCGYFQ